MLDNRNVKAAKSFLQRLRSNNAGNTFAMAAAAMFPIAGVIGGGVDIGRAYMAKARLQQACDAGALAGRRSMSGATMSSADEIEAQKYFAFNFPEGTFGTDPFIEVGGQPNPRFVDGPGDKTVNGYVETTIDTSIMKIFGYQTMQLKVDCTSRLDIGNVDVMMVLDVTGSMGGTLSGSSDSKLEGLKDAVETFYDILGTGGGAQGSQIRYGFVPYNALVNVGEDLYQADTAWLVGGVGNTVDDEWNYQTRRAQWLVPSAAPEVTFETINVAGADGNDRQACENKFGNNQAVSPLWSPGDDGYNSGNPMSMGGDYYEFSFESYDRQSKNNKVCVRKVEKYVGGPPTNTTSDVYQPGAVFDHWEHGVFEQDVSAFVASIDNSNPAALRPTLNTDRNVPPVNDTNGPSDRWEGCIEERDTYADIDPSINAIPDNAYDLDIDLIPHNKATRWRPYWPGVEYKRSNTSNSDYSHYDSTRYQKAGTISCPSKARRLAEYASYESSGTDSDGTVIAGSLKAYIDGFNSDGTTNHTIGMIWGARYLSAEGIFGAENSVSKNGFNISRHIIFMTDGDMVTRADEYNVYGYNELDGRLGPTSLNDADYEDRQENRFQLMCNAAKAKGFTLWVVQFTSNSTVGSHLVSCATSPDHASAATNNSALQTAFGDIAKTIGGLRLSK